MSFFRNLTDIAPKKTMSHLSGNPKLDKLHSLIKQKYISKKGKILFS